MSSQAIIKRKPALPPPTRRAFVALIGAAAAVLAVKRPRWGGDEDRPRSTWSGKTRWIGHC